MGEQIDASTDALAAALDKFATEMSEALRSLTEWRYQQETPEFRRAVNVWEENQ